MKYVSMTLQALVLSAIFFAEYHFFSAFYSPACFVSWVMGASVDRVRLRIRNGLDKH